MTREILFRGKRVDTGEWVYGCLADYMRGHGKCIMPDAYFATRDFNEEDEKGNPVIEDCMAIGGFFPVDPSTVGQFINSCDREDAKLFDGDLVRVSESAPVHEIFWFDSEMRWAIRCVSNGALFNLNCSIMTKCGTIHDNPELLNP